MKSSGTAYLFWLLGLIGLSGLHRFYAGKIVSGLIWFFTFGLLGFGQLIDLFLIPGMITNANLKTVAFSALAGNRQVVNQNVVVNIETLSPSPQVSPPPVNAPAPPVEQMQR